MTEAGRGNVLSRRAEAWQGEVGSRRYLGVTEARQRRIEALPRLDRGEEDAGQDRTEAIRG